MNPTLQQLQQELSSSVQGLDAKQTQLRPPAHPDKWSIQQIVEHLLLTYAATEPALKARLSKGAPTRAKPTLSQRAGNLALFRLGYFPRGRKAPPPVTPQPSLPLCGEDLKQAITESLTSLDKLCAEAANLFGDTAPCASHMILGPLSLDQWRRFQLVHGEHHIKQIAAIRRAHHV
jgi:DinB superfamily